MLISKSTEYLGQFIESDYALLAIPVDVKDQIMAQQKLTLTKNFAE